MSTRLVLTLACVLVALNIVAVQIGMRAEYAAVVEQRIADYDRVRKDDYDLLCNHAYAVRAACVQAHDDKCAADWTEIMKADCGHKESK